MSIAIRLDAKAVTALIESDPDFKLELQRAVAAEVVRKLILKDVHSLTSREEFKVLQQKLTDAVVDDTAFRKQLDERLAGLIQSIRSGTWGLAQQKKPSKELIDLLNKENERIIEDAIRQATESSARIAERITAKYDVLIEAEVDRRINRDVAAKIDAKVKERLAAISAAVAAAPQP